MVVVCKLCSAVGGQMQASCKLCNGKGYHEHNLMPCSTCKAIGGLTTLCCKPCHGKGFLIDLTAEDTVMKFKNAQHIPKGFVKCLVCKGDEEVMKDCKGCASLGYHEPGFVKCLNCKAVGGERTARCKGCHGKGYHASGFITCLNCRAVGGARTEYCKGCFGRGYISKGYVTCVTCKAQGGSRTDDCKGCNSRGFHEPYFVSCPSCKAVGGIITENCKMCSGTGHIVKPHISPEENDFPLFYVICNGCQSTIQGIRYKCNECKGFNYCENCYSRKSLIHDHSHVFEVRTTMSPRKYQQTKQQNGSPQQSQVKNGPYEERMRVHQNISNPPSIDNNSFEKKNLISDNEGGSDTEEPLDIVEWPEGNTFYILSKHCGMVLDVMNEGKKEGNRTCIMPLNHQKSQQWYFDSNGVISNVQSGLVLTSNGKGKVTMQMYDKSEGQKWGWNSTFSTIISLMGHKVLDVKGESKSKMTPVIVWPLTNRSNQHWELIDANELNSMYADSNIEKEKVLQSPTSRKESSHTTPNASPHSHQRAKHDEEKEIYNNNRISNPKFLSGKTFYIRSKHCNMVLDIKEENAKGNTVCIWPFNYHKSQQWHFDSNGVIINVHNGLVLTSKGKGKVTLEKWINSDGQKWMWSGLTSTLISLLDSKVLDIKGESRSKGTSIIIWPVTYRSNQKWELVEVAQSTNSENQKANQQLLQSQHSPQQISTTQDRYEQKPHEETHSPNYQPQSIKNKEPPNSNGPYSHSTHSLSKHQTKRDSSFSEFPEGVNFYIRSKYCDMVLDSVDGSSKEGTRVCVWPFNHQESQQWYSDVEGRVINANSDLVLTCDKKGKVSLESLTHSDEQKWNFNTNYDTISSRMDDRVLDVKGASKEEGTPVITWNANNQMNQQWEIVVIESDKQEEKANNASETEKSKLDGDNSTDVVEGRTFYIRSKLCDMVLDAMGESKKEGTSLCIWPLNYQPNQQWYFDGKGAIKNVYNGLALTCNEKGKTSLEVYNASDSQKWEWNSVYESFTCQLNSKVLDVKGECKNKGTQVITWNANHRLNQQWELIDVNSVNPIEFQSDNQDTYGEEDVEESEWPVEKTFYIRSRHCKMVLDCMGESKNEGTAVCIWPLNNHYRKNQQWFFDKRRAIKNLYNDLVLTSNGKGKVTLEIFCNKKGQKWDYDSNHETIISLLDGKVLDVKGESKRKGTPVITWQPTNRTNQQWELVDINSSEFTTEDNKKKSLLASSPVPNEVDSPKMHHHSMPKSPPKTPRDPTTLKKEIPPNDPVLHPSPYQSYQEMEDGEERNEDNFEPQHREVRSLQSTPKKDDEQETKQQQPQESNPISEIHDSQAQPLSPRQFATPIKSPKSPRKSPQVVTPRYASPPRRATAQEATEENRIKTYSTTPIASATVEPNLSKKLFVTEGRMFYIQSKHCDMVLDAKGDSTKEGTKVCVWPINYQRNQQWYFDYKGVIKNVHSGLVLSANEKGKIVLASLKDKESQQWDWEPSTKTLRCLADDKVMDVKGESKAKGTSIIVWKRTGNINQQWELIDINSVQNIPTNKSQ